MCCCFSRYGDLPDLHVLTHSFPPRGSSDLAGEEDHALVRACLGGDTAAFEALYRRHVGRVHGGISRLLGRRGQHADDLTQDAFVRAWQALASYRFESAFGTWLYQIGRAHV